jgi:hypothetical protein
MDKDMNKLKSLGCRVKVTENDGVERNLLSLFRKKIKLIEYGQEHSFDELEDSEKIFNFLNKERLADKGFKLPATVALVEFFTNSEIDFYGDEEKIFTQTQKRKSIEA